MLIPCNFLKNFFLEIHRVLKLATSLHVNVLVQTENNEISLLQFCVFYYRYIFSKLFIQITMEDTESFSLPPA